MSRGRIAAGLKRPLSKHDRLTVEPVTATPAYIDHLSGRKATGEGLAFSDKIKTCRQ